MSLRRSVWAAAIAAVLTVVEGRTTTADGSRAALDLLRPGSQAAVGLGGDPFLSPLDDQVGWWSHLDLGAPAGSRMRLDASRPAGRGAATGFEGSEAAWNATVGGRVSRASWSAGLGLDRPRWNGGWEGGAGGLSFRGSSTAGEAGLRVRMLPRLTWQLAGTTTSDPADRSRSMFGAGVRYQHPSGSALQGSWQRARRPDELRSSLYDEPIAVSTNLVQESQRLDGVWTSRFGVALEGTVARTRWLPFDTAVPAPVYHFAPAGTSAFDQAGLRWSFPRARALVRWTRLDLDLKGDLSWWGQSFGGFDYARAHLESWLSAFEVGTPRNHRTLLEVERVDLDARARGDLESWPFTSTLVDLLGQRRIFRLEGAARWERWHIGHARPLGRRVRGRAGAEWMDGRPRGKIESWRPAFLVFGRVDDRTDVLRVRRVQLAVLSLGATLSTAALDLDLGLEQCVLAHVRESPASTEPVAGHAPSSMIGNDDSKGVGTRLQLTASRRF